MTRRESLFWIDEGGVASTIGKGSLIILRSDYNKVDMNREHSNIFSNQSLTLLLPICTKRDLARERESDKSRPSHIGSPLHELEKVDWQQCCESFHKTYINRLLVRPTAHVCLVVAMVQSNKSGSIYSNPRILHPQMHAPVLDRMPRARQTKLLHI